MFDNSNDSITDRKHRTLEQHIQLACLQHASYMFQKSKHSNEHSFSKFLCSFQINLEWGYANVQCYIYVEFWTLQYLLHVISMQLSFSYRSKGCTYVVLFDKSNYQRMLEQQILLVKIQILILHIVSDQSIMLNSTSFSKYKSFNYTIKIKI